MFRTLKIAAIAAILLQVAVPSHAADTISADHAADTWIQRYLLSSQAPVALKDLTAAESGANGSQ